MRAKRLFLFILAICWVAGGLASASAHEGEPGYRTGEIHAIRAWARINPVKGRPAAVFFILHNESKVPDALSAVSTPIARRALVHQNKTSGGVTKMIPLVKVPVAAGDMVLFEPGGTHIMLFDLTQTPKPGSRFPLTLTFAKGKPQTIEVEAKGLADKAPEPAMEHMHH
jgi:periplasmic copper chaperone A